jgi:hypothetical protein
MTPLLLNPSLEYLPVVHDLGQEGLAGYIFIIQKKQTLLKYNNSIISSIRTPLFSKPLSINFLDSFPYPNYPYLSEYVLFVNCGVIVCLFDFQ